MAAGPCRGGARADGPGRGRGHSTVSPVGEALGCLRLRAFRNVFLSFSHSVCKHYQPVVIHPAELPSSPPRRVERASHSTPRRKTKSLSPLCAVPVRVPRLALALVRGDCREHKLQQAAVLQKLCSAPGPPSSHRPSEV